MRHFAILAVLVLGGCGGAARIANPLESEARSTLAAMTADFQSGQSEAFLARFDRRDFPNYNDFEERTRDFIQRTSQRNVDLIVDSIVSENGEVSVSTHWNRSFIEQGANKLEEGRCEFVFRRRDSGGLALLVIRGDSPF